MSMHIPEARNIYAHLHDRAGDKDVAHSVIGIDRTLDRAWMVTSPYQQPQERQTESVCVCECMKERERKKDRDEGPVISGEEDRRLGVARSYSQIGDPLESSRGGEETFWVGWRQCIEPIFAIVALTRFFLSFLFFCDQRKRGKGKMRDADKTRSTALKYQGRKVSRLRIIKSRETSTYKTAQKLYPKKRYKWE